MHTFAKKPKAPQETDAAKSGKSGRALSGGSHDVDSLLHLQGTIGNRAVQRLLRSKTKSLETNLPNSELVVQRDDDARAEETDRVRAEREVIVRPLYSMYPTAGLTSVAVGLDAELMSGTLGPRMTVERARSLLEIHDTIERRLQAPDARTDVNGLPQPAGSPYRQEAEDELGAVDWEATSPLAGRLEDIVPFGNIDLWTALANGAPVRTVRGRRQLHHREGSQVSPDAQTPLDLTEPNYDEQQAQIRSVYREIIQNMGPPRRPPIAGQEARANQTFVSELEGFTRAWEIYFHNGGFSFLPFPQEALERGRQRAERVYLDLQRRPRWIQQGLLGNREMIMHLIRDLRNNTERFRRMYTEGAPE